MSSFEPNIYTAKPSVQVSSSVSVTKPIVASTLLVKPLQSEHPLQPKKIQPVPRTIRDNNTAAGYTPKQTTAAASPVFQLKNLYKTASPSRPIGTDYNSRVAAASENIAVKRPLLENSARKTGKEASIKPAPQAIQKRILAVQPKPESMMGNEQASVQTPTTVLSSVSAVSGSNTLNAVTAAATSASHNNIPVPVAAMNASLPHSLNPRMASIINAPGDGRTGNNPSPPSMYPPVTGPRVVSTSSSKTITGSGVTSSPIRHQISHRVASVGARTPVIQAAQGAAAAVRGQQQPIVRSVTPPMHTAASVAHRPLNPSVSSAQLPAGSSSHQSQNPTTVQITIHQPKLTVSNTAASTEKLVTHHAAGPYGAISLSHTSQSVGLSVATPPPPQVTLSTQQGLQQQRLVISQGHSGSGAIHLNKTSVLPSGSHEPSRIIATQNAGHTLTALKKSVRAPGGSSGPTAGQHDYIRTDTVHVTGSAASMRKVGGGDTFRTNRAVLPMHTLPDHRVPTVNTGFFPNTSTVASYSNMGGTFHPTTINNLEQHQPVFKTHNYNNMSSSSQHVFSCGAAASPTVPTIISTTSGILGSVSGGSSHALTGDNSSSHHNSHSAVGPGLSGTRHGGGGGVSPSILRKRTLVDRPIEKDNASQSSTDTAMSSESPNQQQPTVKTEPADLLENGIRGAADGHISDVSPRKKPRKQLLNTAAQLKDRHDSSTEEETETKKERRSPPLVPAHPSRPLHSSHTKSSTLGGTKDGFTDDEGCKWVKMRQRQADPLLCFYNCNWKSRNNHFQRYSDVKVKEERRPVVSELSNQKGIQQKASGWKLYHISAQFEEMMETEEALNSRMGRLQRLLPGRGKDKHPELHKISELAQANKQRCAATKDQLHEAQSSMISILTTHKPKILEIIQKNHSKRPVKKKERP